jgi:hypothetical protein
MSTAPNPDLTIAWRIMAETGMSADDVLKLSADEYARLTHRETATEAATRTLGYAGEPAAPTSPSAPQSGPQANADAPQGLDPNSPEYFHAWRQSRARGGEGRGIFDSVNSHSDAYTAAVRQQAGRTAYSQGNVEPAARIERVFIQDAPVQGRTMGYR